MPHEIEIKELSEAANKRAMGKASRYVGLWLTSFAVLGVALWAFSS